MRPRPLLFDTSRPRPLFLTGSIGNVPLSCRGLNLHWAYSCLALASNSVTRRSGSSWRKHRYRIRAEHFFASALVNSAASAAFPCSLGSCKSQSALSCCNILSTTLPFSFGVSGIDTCLLSLPVHKGIDRHSMCFVLRSQSMKQNTRRNGVYEVMGI